MQEEIENKTLSLIINTSKFTERTLATAFAKALKLGWNKAKEHHQAKPQGRQSVKQLIGQNQGVSNIEITDQNIRAFSSTAKKHGLDFALKKDTSGEHTRYLVFFKGRDADVITAAFREFSAKNLSREKAPSIRRKLEKAQEQSKTQHKEQERGKKVKTRERSVER